MTSVMAANTAGGGGGGGGGAKDTRTSWFKKRKKTDDRPTLGPEVMSYEQDHTVITDSSDNLRRRTLHVVRRNAQSWGFTLQSYGIHHTKQKEIDTLTYVDYVDFGGPAYIAGMQAGDVILSIDGVSMESCSHMTLIEHIRQKRREMRLVVLFEDCVRKVELHLRLRKLKNLLAAKEMELKSLEAREKRITQGLGSATGDRLSLRSVNSGGGISLPADTHSLNLDPNHALQPTSVEGQGHYSSASALRNQQFTFDDCDVQTNCSSHSRHLVADSTDVTMASPVTSCSSPNLYLNPRVDQRYTSLPQDRKQMRSDRALSYVGQSTFYDPVFIESTDFCAADSDSIADSDTLSRDNGVYQSWTGYRYDPDAAGRAARHFRSPDPDSGSYNTWSGNRKQRDRRRQGTRSIGNSLFYVSSEDAIDCECDDVSDIAGTSASFDHAHKNVVETGNTTTQQQLQRSYEQMGARPKTKSYMTAYSDSQLSVRPKSASGGSARGRPSLRIATNIDDSSHVTVDESYSNCADVNLVKLAGARSPRPASLPIIPAEQEIQCVLNEGRAAHAEKFRDSGFGSPVFMDHCLPSDEVAATTHSKQSKHTHREQFGSGLHENSLEYKEMLTATPTNYYSLPRTKAKPKVLHETKVPLAASTSSSSLSMKKLFARSPSMPSLTSKSRWSPLEFTRNKLRSSLAKLRRKSGSYNVDESKQLSLPVDHAQSQSGQDVYDSDAALVRSVSNMSVAATAELDELNAELSGRTVDSAAASSGIEVYATLPRKSRFLSFGRRSKSTANIQTSGSAAPAAGSVTAPLSLPPNAKPTSTSRCVDSANETLRDVDHQPQQLDTEAAAAAASELNDLQQRDLVIPDLQVDIVDDLQNEFQRLADFNFNSTTSTGAVRDSDSDSCKHQQLYPCRRISECELLEEIDDVINTDSFGTVKGTDEAKICTDDIAIDADISVAEVAHSNATGTCDSVGTVKGTCDDVADVTRDDSLLNDKAAITVHHAERTEQSESTDNLAEITETATEASDDKLEQTEFFSGGSDRDVHVHVKATVGDFVSERPAAHTPSITDSETFERLRHNESTESAERLRLDESVEPLRDCNSIGSTGCVDANELSSIDSDKHALEAIDQPLDSISDASDQYDSIPDSCSTAELPEVAIQSDAELPEDAIQSDADLPEVVAQSDADLPEVAIQSDAELPEVAIQSDADLPEITAQSDTELPEVTDDDNNSIAIIAEQTSLVRDSCDVTLPSDVTDVRERDVGSDVNTSVDSSTSVDAAADATVDAVAEAETRRGRDRTQRSATNVVKLLTRRNKTAFEPKPTRSSLLRAKQTTATNHAAAGTNTTNHAAAGTNTTNNAAAASSDVKVTAKLRDQVQSVTSVASAGVVRDGKKESRVKLTSIPFKVTLNAANVSRTLSVDRTSSTIVTSSSKPLPPADQPEKPSAKQKLSKLNSLAKRDDVMSRSTSSPRSSGRVKKNSRDETHDNGLGKTASSLRSSGRVKKNSIDETHNDVINRSMSSEIGSNRVKKKSREETHVDVISRSTSSARSSGRAKKNSRDETQNDVSSRSTSSARGSGRIKKTSREETHNDVISRSTSSPRSSGRVKKLSREETQIDVFSRLSASSALSSGRIKKNSREETHVDVISRSTSTSSARSSGRVKKSTSKDESHDDVISSSSPRSSGRVKKFKEETNADVIGRTTSSARSSGRVKKCAREETHHDSMGQNTSSIRNSGRGQKKSTDETTNQNRTPKLRSRRPSDDKSKSFAPTAVDVSSDGGKVPVSADKTVVFAEVKRSVVKDQQALAVDADKVGTSSASFSQLSNGAAKTASLAPGTERARAAPVLSTPAKLAVTYGAQIRSRSKSPMKIRRHQLLDDAIPGCDVSSTTLVLPEYSGRKPRTSSIGSFTVADAAVDDGATKPTVYENVVKDFKRFPAPSVREKREKFETQQQVIMPSESKAPAAVKPGVTIDNSKSKGKSGLVSTSRVQTDVTSPVASCTSSVDKLKTDVTSPVASSSSGVDKLKTDVTSPVASNTSGISKLKTENVHSVILDAVIKSAQQKQGSTVMRSGKTATLNGYIDEQKIGKTEALSNCRPDVEHKDKQGVTNAGACEKTDERARDTSLSKLRTRNLQSESDSSRSGFMTISASAPNAADNRAAAVQSRKMLSSVLQKCMNRDGITALSNAAPSDPSNAGCRKPIVATPAHYQAYLNSSNTQYSCETQL